jgi:hypothetical protein
VIDEAPVGDLDDEPFLTAKLRDGFSRYEGPPTGDELERFFFWMIRIVG